MEVMVSNINPELFEKLAKGLFYELKHEILKGIRNTLFTRVRLDDIKTEITYADGLKLFTELYTTKNILVNTHEFENTIHIGMLSEGSEVVISKYINEYKHLDLQAIADEYKISIEEVVYIFGVLHEYGHLRTHVKDIIKYGDFETAMESNFIYKYKVESIKDLTERRIAYRMIKGESLADDFAVMCFNKYKDIIMGMYMDIKRPNVEW